MNRTLIAILVAVSMMLMSVPGQVSAHESKATDLNEIAYNHVWDLLGPGGATDDPAVKGPLSNLGLDAEKRGGASATGCNHHDPGVSDGKAYDPNDQCTWSADEDPGSVQEMTFYQCNGSDSFDSPTETTELGFETPFPVNHTDLENGIFEATGSFFVPVEFVGPQEEVDKVAEVWFGFAHTFAWPASSSLCQPPFPMSGAYYEFYRGDTTPEDGWEIPVNTLLVPDAPYGAVLRALDSEGNTLAASFVYSNVNNYLDDSGWSPGTPSTCDQDSDTGTALCNYHDTTPPRASVFKYSEMDDQFPRGEDGGCLDGIGLEYGEPLATNSEGAPRVEITYSDGSSVTYQTYNAPNRDVDSAPLFTVNTDDWGPGICIPNPSDTFTVKAWDQSGNIGKQTITP